MPRGRTKPASPALRPLGLRSAELEAAILAQPAEVGPRSVLADWLLERGDLRGQLIALQLGAEKKPASIGDQADAFMKKHAQIAEGHRLRDPRARPLGLSGVSLAGAETLERCAAAFKHLERLDLSYPRFPHEWLARLRVAGLAAGATVTVSRPAALDLPR
ncbi:MAG: TIGR02996 domain-containing protein [Archangium sp.]|nr:TIGR02996 domain-containing protein [Archangium sp.]